MSDLSYLPPSLSVLIVEDSVPQRQHAVRLCEQIGFTDIWQCGNGQEALDLLASDRLPRLPHLLLLDLSLPGMDGIEILVELGLRNYSVPIVLASSHERALIESVVGMSPYILAGLSKPLSLEALHGALKGGALLHGHTDRRQSPRTPVTVEMLREAIAQGQIVPHYQPKVDGETALLRGVEALARWKHPELGWIPPDQFVPLAEREGLIRDLTLHMMDRSFAQCASWAAHGLRLTMAVNLSPHLLRHATVVEDICTVKRRHGLQPSQVVLEVTESTVVEQAGPGLSALARLRLKGFGLAIDDYGTGFSSMLQLARIPFTELKIDRSFVHGASSRKGLRVILESAMGLARGLEIATVGEGVETMEDWRLLQQFGCSTGQGWLIAKAMDGDELPLWIKNHHLRLRDLRSPGASPLQA
ncbi:EAL domain-containing response regulator [Amphibiibacter pelophylacis]|uniref:EAL domain-containing response regulator n=1 Tax=Amphibiibacter pelophylacis TaxID=1799477 RepID=A0ACC6P2J5_9BURK